MRCSEQQPTISFTRATVRKSSSNSSILNDYSHSKENGRGFSFGNKVKVKSVSLFIFLSQFTYLHAIDLLTLNYQQVYQWLLYVSVVCIMTDIVNILIMLQIRTVPLSNVALYESNTSYSNLEVPDSTRAKSAMSGSNANYCSLEVKQYYRYYLHRQCSDQVYHWLKWLVHQKYDNSLYFHYRHMSHNSSPYTSMNTLCQFLQ